VTKIGRVMGLANRHLVSEFGMAVYLETACKNLPYFFMVHLLHRLYGVDAPG